jgi:hypothetical protein
MGNGAERKSAFATSNQSNDGDVRLDVKDTDFLLKLMLDSNFPGRDIEQVYHTMTKVAQLHRQGINGGKE